MIKGKILIADDEPDILEIISFNLRKDGYDVMTAKNGAEALEIARSYQPDLIILDAMMPMKNGFEVCQQLRLQPEFQHTLIIFLTALGDDNSEIRGLEAGADDFLTKPVSPKVLLSKVQSLFRRVGNDDAKVLIAGDLKIDRERFLVTVQGREVVLARKEFELLALLASKPGKVFLRNEILNQVWGTEVIVGDRTIDVHIRKIRQKLDMDCIATVKGVGYKFTG
ncbi:MAG TPA: response regulator transcription factor [Ferruginibacter sp.]|mgnify:CR=1 FL=1|nr:DNA-binding response regulator [Chitinophagaceae bacterium]HML57888.1 response regulator transcription factor [Ferruginibacter sp.]HRN91283.1 response regulator transcription factor [Ferruginibacter sp.]HRO05463.1 response regulator transcription factor [Ferruginibacter sp.]HRO96179.1 response regulator transcription factor [Ferruginibacter sp.]